MNISKQIAGYLKSRALVLASVETCTAGHLAALLADVPGASACLDIGLIVHRLAADVGMPGVCARTVAQHGLVSEAVACELAEGVLAQRAGYADVVVASLGLLPSQRDANEPLMHCFAWACMHGERVFCAGETVLFSGRSNEIRRSVARRALLGVPRFVDAVVAR